jgi:hypothetical protein
MIEFERSLAARMAGIQSRRMFRFVDPSSLRMMALRSDFTRRSAGSPKPAWPPRRARCACATPGRC